MEALLIEIDYYVPLIANHTLLSCYFGGGTPYLFGPNRIKKILNKFPNAHFQEITLEANPENITKENLDGYYSAGINRLSFGVQSFQQPELDLLGRKHSYKQILDALSTARNSGFSNISIDLIYDLPYQSKKTWFDTLQRALELPVTHMSLYNLTIEPHTQFWRKKEELSSHMPKERESALRYTKTVELASKFGFEQYEISAFAKKGFCSIHNVGYWTGEPYLGFGPSASSFYAQARFTAVKDLKKYCSSIKNKEFIFDEVEVISKPERFKELLAVGLRYHPGVDSAQLESIVGVTMPKETIKTLTLLENEGFISKNENVIQLTKKGRLLYDTIASWII